MHPWEQGPLPRYLQIPMLVDSRPAWPLTHILHLEVEFLLEIVDGGGTRYNGSAQGSAAGNDAVKALQGCQCPSLLPNASPL